MSALWSATWVRGFVFRIPSVLILRMICGSLNKFHLHAFADASKKPRLVAIYKRAITECEFSINVDLRKVSTLSCQRIIKTMIWTIGCISRSLNFALKKRSSPLKCSCGVTTYVYCSGFDLQNQSWTLHRKSLTGKTTVTCIFHYVSRNQNPADILAKEIRSQKLQNENLWWYQWRWSPNSSKVADPMVINEVNENSEIDHLAPARVKESLAEYILDVKRYSSWCKHLRIIAYALRLTKIASRYKFDSTKQISADVGLAPPTALPVGVVGKALSRSHSRVLQLFFESDRRVLS